MVISGAGLEEFMHKVLDGVETVIDAGADILTFHLEACDDCKSLLEEIRNLGVMAGIAVVSLVCCLGQFAFGRFIGRRNGEIITGGQSLGQKNTVFAIWFAYTFLTPVTAIAGGFYSLWHNLVNTRQLYRHNHEKK